MISAPPGLGSLLLALLRGQHGARTVGRIAEAGEGFLDRGRVALLVFEGVVVVQFLATLDVALGEDVDAAIVLLRLAIRIAGVVDEARVVAARAAIDHLAIVQREEEGVVDRPALLLGANGRFLGRDALAGVFLDAFTGADLAPGEDAI